MEHNEAASLKDNRNMMAMVSILFSVIGCVAGFLGRGTGTSGFSAGTVLTFIALLLSLSSVEDHGKNALQMIAFFLAVAAMFFAVGICAVTT